MTRPAAPAHPSDAGGMRHDEREHPEDYAYIGQLHDWPDPGPFAGPALDPEVPPRPGAPPPDRSASRRTRSGSSGARGWASRRASTGRPPWASTASRSSTPGCGTSPTRRPRRSSAVNCGDGVGSDVLSFDENEGSEQFVE